MGVPAYFTFSILTYAKKPPIRKWKSEEYIKVVEPGCLSKTRSDGVAGPAFTSIIPWLLNFEGGLCRL